MKKQYRSKVSAPFRIRLRRDLVPTLYAMAKAEQKPFATFLRITLEQKAQGKPPPPPPYKPGTTS